MQFDTKFAIVVADDLPVWKKLNVVAFLSGGVTATSEVTTGDVYQDANSNEYLPLCVQPIIVLKSTRSKLSTIIQRAQREGVKSSVYIEDMFATGHDDANRETVSQYETIDLPVVGVAMCASKKLVDKIVKGAKLHD